MIRAMTDHNGRYRLVGKLAVPEPNLREWSKVFGENRHVGDTKIGGVRISTVFLGLDHSHGHGPPLLFETMVFRGGDGDETERYSSWAEAEAGHKRWVEKVRAEIRAKANQ